MLKGMTFSFTASIFKNASKFILQVDKYSATIEMGNI